VLLRLRAHVALLPPLQVTWAGRGACFWFVRRSPYSVCVCAEVVVSRTTPVSSYCKLRIDGRRRHSGGHFHPERRWLGQLTGTLRTYYTFSLSTDCVLHVIAVKRTLLDEASSAHPNCSDAIRRNPVEPALLPAHEFTKLTEQPAPWQNGRILGRA
jgi:hypothetical protein